MTSRSLLPLLALAFIGCGGGDSGAVDGGPPPRVVEVDLEVTAGGFSEPFEVTVPEGVRSITIVATGSADALYGLGSFRTADNVERVGIDLGTAPGPGMRASYDTEQIGQMSGALFQTIRLGTFTHVFPYRPDQAVTAGSTSFRIASDKPGPVHVSVVMPPDDGGKILHLNLIAVSETLTLTQTPSFLDGLQTIFTQAGITVIVDNVLELRGTGLSVITDSTEPQEAPASMSAQLPGLVANRFTNDALDIFIVDSLPAGIGGLSLGTPGPPLRGGYYFGLLVRRSTNDSQLAVVIAHETSHFLALQHVTNVGVSGKVYPDPLDDTQTGQMNLMQSGSKLTADQAFALSRSALLRAE